MKFRTENQEIEGWKISFKNNVHMYCHKLDVEKEALRFNLQCEDTPAGGIGVWMTDLELSDEVQNALSIVLAKFFTGLGRPYKIYRQEGDAPG